MFVYIMQEQTWLSFSKNIAKNPSTLKIAWLSNAEQVITRNSFVDLWKCAQTSIIHHKYARNTKMAPKTWLPEKKNISEKKDARHFFSQKRNVNGDNPELN